MKKLIRKILKYRLAPNSIDADKFYIFLKKKYKGKVHGFMSGKEIDGWEIPKAWDVKKANIFINKKKFFDGYKNPLGVISYSSSFHGKISKKNFLKKVYTHNKIDNAIVYHWKQFYNLENDWGFCIPKEKLKKITNNDEIFIELETIKKSNTMKVFDLCLKGKSDNEILFFAHSCHSSQANDDASGISVMLKIYEKLKKQKNKKFSYRFIIAPEIYGPLFWLDKLKKDKIRKIRGCIKLAAVGNNDILKLQKSYNGNSFLDKIFENIAQNKNNKLITGKFRKIYGNDEIVFEAPKYSIPTISFTRVKKRPLEEYPEYHTNLDNIDIIFDSKLNHTVNIVMKGLSVLENNQYIIPKFSGLPKLSNPKYNLFLNVHDPASMPNVSKLKLKLNYFLNCFSREITNFTCIEDISNKYKIEDYFLKNYLQKWVEKKLIEIL